MEISLENKAMELASQHYTTCIVSGNREGDEPGYVLSHPELPGCMAEGDTLDEANEYLKDATFGYILLLLEHGIDVPKPDCCTNSMRSNAKTIIREVGEEIGTAAISFCIST